MKKTKKFLKSYDHLSVIRYREFQAKERGRLANISKQVEEFFGKENYDLLVKAGVAKRYSVTLPT